MKLLGKVLLGAGIVTGGIFVGGVVWNDGESVETIKGHLDNMKQEFVQVVEDNEFLKDKFNELKGVYDLTVTEANNRISSLISERDRLYSQIEGLKGEIATEGEISEEQELIQAEIDRLEAELEKANQEIAALESYAASVDASTEYEALDRKAFEIEELELQNVGIPISVQAKELDATKAQIMADNEKHLENELRGNAIPGVDIIGVRTYDDNGTTVLAYEIAEDVTPTGANSRQSVVDFMKSLGYSKLIFIEPTGSIIEINKWQQITQK